MTIPFLPALCFSARGGPPRDDCQPDWAHVAAEMKRKGVTLTLLWQEYRSAHPEGYGHTWFCGQFHSFQKRTRASFRNRHEAGAVMRTDDAGHTIPVTDPGTGEVHRAPDFVAVLGASSLTVAWASLTQNLPDRIEAQCRALAFFGGVPRASSIGLEPMAPQWTTLRQSQGRGHQAALVRADCEPDI